MRLTLLAAAAMVSLAPSVRAQDAPPPTTTSPAASPDDVRSVDAILGALYDVISGPAGTPRNWDRMRSLFAPGARLVPTGRRQDGTPLLLNWDVEEYIRRVGPRLEADGFFEREVARRSERYGSIVHAFSTYESRHAATDSLPFMRGINSIQLWSDGTRWWVISVFWEGERPDNPIPPQYLTGGGH